MGIEIERKFAVKDERWRRFVIDKKHITQGYFLGGKNGLVRVRVIDRKKLKFTLKGKSNGLSRKELEWEVPASPEDIADALAMCDGTLEKTRHIIPHGQGLCWEVDEFHGVNEGLIVAEIELNDEEQPFSKPSWLGDELVEDCYRNASLIRKPYTTW